MTYFWQEILIFSQKAVKVHISTFPCQTQLKLLGVRGKKRADVPVLLGTKEVQCTGVE